MAQQKVRGVSRAARRNAKGAAEETAKRSRSTASDAASTTAHAARDGLESVEEAGEQVRERGRRAGGSDASSGTLSGELRDIVREAALDVLVPVARRATTQAAKYAIRRGPQLAQDTAERLGPRIEEAGGPGEFAKGALSSVSGARAGMLEKLGVGGRGEQSDDGSWFDRRLPVEVSIDVVVPLETAYERFSDFEEHARFMSDGEIVDERPNERVTWSGESATAVITFHRLSDRLTRVMVTFDRQPQGLLERTGSLLGRTRRSLDADLRRFKGFVEMGEEDPETGAEEYDEDADGRDPESGYDEEPDEGDDEEPEAAYEDEDEEEDEEEPEPAPRRPARRRPAARPRQQKAGRR